MPESGGKRGARDCSITSYTFTVFSWFNRPDKEHYTSLLMEWRTWDETLMLNNPDTVSYVITPVSYHLMSLESECLGQHTPACQITLAIVLYVRPTLVTFLWLRCINSSVYITYFPALMCVNSPEKQQFYHIYSPAHLASGTLSLLLSLWPIWCVLRVLIDTPITRSTDPVLRSVVPGRFGPDSDSLSSMIINSSS